MDTRTDVQKDLQSRFEKENTKLHVNLQKKKELIIALDFFPVF